MADVLTQNAQLDAALRREVVLVAGHTGVRGLVGGLLHVVDVQRAVLDALSHVGRQPDALWTDGGHVKWLVDTR